jgi:hypothetical protein
MCTPRLLVLGELLLICQLKLLALGGLEHLHKNLQQLNTLLSQAVAVVEMVVLVQVATELQVVLQLPLVLQ